MVAHQRIAFVLFVLLVVSSAPTLAAPSDSTPVGLPLPWSFGAEQSGVESVLHHAAGLGFMEGFGFGLGFSASVLGEEALDGVVALGGARLGPLSVGLGYSYVGSPTDFTSGTHRLDVSTALRLFEGLSLGLQYTELHAQGGEPSSEALGEDEGGALYQSVALSATYRPHRVISLSLGAERLNQPLFLGEDLAPTLAFGVGLRPGTERVAFGIEGRVSAEQDPFWSAAGTLRFIPVPGLVIGGYGRYGRTPGQADMMSWGGYLALEQGLISAAVTTDRRDPATSGGLRAMSLGTLITMHTQARPSLVQPRGVIVKVPISGPIAERYSAELLGPEVLPFGYWLALLEMMRHDESVDGVMLDIQGAPLWAQCWELRQALERLKAAGKSVSARLVWGDMRAMYLASAADRIYLHPAGGLALTGLGVTQTYLKGLLDTLGIQAQFVKWSEYKSASEPLSLSGPSESAKEQGREMLNIFSRFWREAVMRGRSLAASELAKVLETGPQTMKSAHQERLIDRVVHDDALEEALSDDLGRAVHIVEGYRPAPRAWRRWSSPRKVAIIPVVGTIIDGKTQAFRLPIFGATTGEADFIAHLERALQDPDVVGIVVRVSSPGGSVVASERMHRAVTKARERKPLIVSFGDFAASGGYYLASAAERIITTPLSITGSIGIFTGKVDLSGLYGKIGVTTHTEKTAPHADAQGAHRPWTEGEMKRARERLKAYYDLFVGHVAKGRKMSVEKAEERARGRVYLGERAVTLNLADAEGSLWDAIAQVRVMAGLSSREAIDLDYGPAPSFSQKLVALLGGVFGGSKGTNLAIPESLRPIQRMLQALVALDGGQIQARLPYDIEVQ